MKWRIENNRINETKSCLSKKINKIEKHLGRLTKKKREEKPITKVRNESGDIITYFTEIKRIIR